MFPSIIVVAIAFAGVAIAFTPPGFEPASTNNLTVVFGNVLAINGKDIPKADTANAPTIGTTTKLFGTYAIMMVDPDIPPSAGSTNELLHWMQAGLTSANTATTIGGVKVFELVNTANESALASYIQPSPPNKAPLSHRYTQMLLNTTGNSSVLATLQSFAKTRGNFSAANVVKAAGITVLAGNSFNVTNGGTLTQANITILANTTSSAGSKATTTSKATSSSLRASATSSQTGGNGTAATTSVAIPKSTGGAGTGKSGGAFIAGLGALAAAVVLL